MEYVPIPVLETRRLLLRKLNMQDASHYFTRLGSSEQVTENMLWDPHRDISESIASIRKTLARYEAGRCYRWGIALRSDDSLIGVIELLRFDEAANTCSFAYMLGEDFWGVGYGTEALEAVFRFAFTECKIEAIVSDHFAENPASGAAMRKAGMRYVGTLSGKYEKHGIRHDALQYRITKEEWVLCNSRSRDKTQ